MKAVRRSRAWRWLGAPVGTRDISRADVGLGILLSALGLLVVSSNTEAHAAAIALMPLTTLPVIVRRRWPLAAAGAATGGIVVSVLATGSMVRCGAALPAAFFIAYANGLRQDLRPAIAGIVVVLGNVAVQAFNDPNLGRPPLVVLGPLTLGFWASGRLVRSRQVMTAALRLKTRELRQQREATAALAVANDRARVLGGLETSLHRRIADIAATAEGGRHGGGAHQALASIEQSGRDTLGQMREVVGTLRGEDAPTRPQPDLAQLRALLDTASADARLTIEGDPRQLPASIELSAYRVVEHLLGALEDEAGASIEVLVRFDDTALELRVAGHASKVGRPEVAIGAARERVVMHGGTIDSTSAAGRLEALVRLPLVSAHA